MKLVLFHLRPAPGYVFCICLRTGGLGSKVALQMGFCFSANVAGPYVIPCGGFRRASDVGMTHIWAEPVEFGWLPGEHIEFDPIPAPEWLAHTPRRTIR